MSRSQPAALCTVLALLMVGSLPISESVPTEKNIIVYQNTYNDYGTVYRMVSSRFAGHGYSRVDGTNSPAGAASYVRGYARAYPAEYHRNCGICKKYLVRGGFETTLKVCSIRQQTQGGTVRVFHAFVPSDACEWVNQYVSNTVVTTVQTMTTAYVSRVYREAENPRRFVATLCRGYGDFLYGTVSTEDGFCQPGNGIINRFEFFAYGGHKFCPKLQDGSTWSIMYTRQHGVRETTALYSCSTGYTLEDGDGQLHCNNAGMWQGTTPTCQPINCGSPPHVANGNFVGGNYSYMATVRLECNLGYEASDSYTRLQCQATGHWSQRNLLCEIRNCSYQLALQNGRVVMSTGYSYLDEIAYECGVGYRLEGSASAICTESGDWSTVTPVCKRVCEAPLQPLHGTRYGDNFDVGAVVAFSCFEGFDMDGARELTCEQHGGQTHWSGRPPVCSAPSCSCPSPPQNGRVVIHNGYNTLDEIAYECLVGYRLEGSASAICTESGDWSEVTPVCHKIVCVVPLQPLHGAHDGDNFDVGAVVAFSCFEGFVMLGVSALTCEQHGGQGQWSGRPPVCDASDCGLPATPDNGNVRADATTFGSRVDFECNTGYLLVGVDYATCTSEGWDAAIPECQQIMCPEPTIATNSRWAGDDFSYGSIVVYSCDYGYTINGTNTIICQDTGAWSDPIPRCIVSCDAGFFLRNLDDDHCTPCPIGTYQRLQGSTECVICPEDSTTIAEGSSHPTMCSERISTIEG